MEGVHGTMNFKHKRKFRERWWHGKSWNGQTMMVGEDVGMGGFKGSKSSGVGFEGSKSNGVALVAKDDRRYVSLEAMLMKFLPLEMSESVDTTAILLEGARADQYAT